MFEIEPQLRDSVTIVLERTALVPQRLNAWLPAVLVWSFNNSVSHSAPSAPLPPKLMREFLGAMLELLP